MAYRAGMALKDMEFVQFHPTALYIKGAPRFLLSEALRGEGGQLRNIDLERFMARYHEAAELAPRDVVSRSIVTEMHKCQSEFVYLDMTGLDPEHVKKRFPRIHSTCAEYNLDITGDLMPVRPAAHYAMGGVATDLNGATTLAGLFAAGEVAATGVHGANRLASNSLLEGLVYGAHAARAMMEGRGSLQVEPPAKARMATAAPSASQTPDPPSKGGSRKLDQVVDEIRTLLWENVGIIRQGKDLQKALQRLQAIAIPESAEPSRAAYEARNILEVALAITSYALAREESRGAHYRTDFPLKDATTPPRHSLVGRDSAVFFQPRISTGQATPAPQSTRG